MASKKKEGFHSESLVWPEIRTVRHVEWGSKREENICDFNKNRSMWRFCFAHTHIHTQFLTGGDVSFFIFMFSFSKKVMGSPVTPPKQRKPRGAGHTLASHHLISSPPLQLCDPLWMPYLRTVLSCVSVSYRLLLGTNFRLKTSVYVSVWVIAHSVFPH